ncbi:Protoporphyrinogen oxidase [Handroanthus impetiginosus]|uniref:Protoporphyrinogen oxidase n=1 Tax=Handroanthus impetiginosus TaxID=429701 RepID=A0A2G9HRF6_9LAMI|nr:Protoporphyrinogen oxidase [Handroanthus impetiginosus]
MGSFTGAYSHSPAFNSFKPLSPLYSSPPFRKFKILRHEGAIRKIRCSVAGGPAAVSPSSESDNQKPMLDCVIVGAGISGLCIAQALATKHSNSNLMVTEARERVGGNITTVERDGYLWEEGPNSFQPSDPVLTMAVDSGLKDELVLGDPNAPRFVLWNGKLRPVPSKPTDLPFFDLMSFPGKIRAGLGAIGLRPPPPVTGPRGIS